MKNIAQKLNAIRKTIQHPNRSRHVDFGDYDYSTRDDIFETARIELVKHGVEAVPSMTLVSREPVGTEQSGKPNMRHHVRVKVEYICCETGESVTQTWDGESVHFDEKGIQMAGTQAIRFAITDMFMLLDGAELDYEAGSDGNAENHEVHRKKAAPADPMMAVVDLLEEAGLDGDQVARMGQWLAGMEDVEDVTEISEARMMVWFNTFNEHSPDEIAEKACAALKSMEGEEAA